LWRGFDVYRYVEPSADYALLPIRRALLPLALETAGIVRNRNDYRPAGDINEDALRFLQRHRSRPFFLWVHYYDAHQPYTPERAHRSSEFHPGRGFLQRFGSIFSYDSEIVGVDESIGVLLDELQQTGRLDGTIVVVTADHGEGLGQHDYDGHTHRVWEEQLRIPMIFRYPSLLPAGRRIEVQIRSIDVVPTVLELMGLPVPANLDGSSLLRVIAGADREDRLSFAELLFRTNVKASLASVSDGRFKLIRSFDGRHWLFDLKDDPAELEDVAGSHPDALTRLDAALTGYLAMGPEEGQDPEAMDPELRQRLEALGYLQ
jgi:arylsulfatase A-like enzyme